MFRRDGQTPDPAVNKRLSDLAEQNEEILRTLTELRGRLDLLSGQISAVEWLVKLQPAGVPVGDGRILTKTLYDTLLYVDADDRLIAPHLILDRAFEPEVSLLLQQMVQTGDTFVDVGANIGYYTCSMARKVGPTGKVYAFEANSEPFALLQDNVIINNALGWTRCRNVAVWETRSTLELHSRKRAHGNTSIIKLSAEDLAAFGDTSETFQVECDTLDALLTGHQGRIDLIKIDVEGAEAGVLKGMRETIRRNPKVRIILEWALWTIRGADGTPEEMWKLMQDTGLGIYKIESDASTKQTNLKELLATEFCYLLLAK